MFGKREPNTYWVIANTGANLAYVMSKRKTLEQALAEANARNQDSEDDTYYYVKNKEGEIIS